MVLRCTRQVLSFTSCPIFGGTKAGTPSLTFFNLIRSLLRRTFDLSRRATPRSVLRLQQGFEFFFFVPMVASCSFLTGPGDVDLGYEDRVISSSSLHLCSFGQLWDQEVCIWDSGPAVECITIGSCKSTPWWPLIFLNSHVAELLWITLGWQFTPWQENLDRNWYEHTT